jgi:hypothetical protein
MLQASGYPTFEEVSNQEPEVRIALCGAEGGPSWVGEGRRILKPFGRRDKRGVMS